MTTRPKRWTRATLIALLPALTLALAAGADARPATAGDDNRPNILVVMTDDMAASDVAVMPNVRRLLARQGTTFTNAIDSFPLCCPARATFITGQYAHNHGVKGNFHPYGWYGMKDRDNILPTWLQEAGYRTSLVGKWLNGYGARDAHGEVPKGFDIWRGLLDVSAYDYFNFVMNADGKLRTWGDSDFASKLVEFANIEVIPGISTVDDILGKLFEVFGPPPYEYWGTERAKDYSPDVTAEITEQLVEREGKRKDPFFIWWSVAAPHREDVSTTLMARPGPDPRPAPRYADDVDQLALPRPPSFNEADLSDKPSNLQKAAPSLTEDEIEQLRLDYQGRVGSLMAVDDGVAELVKTLRRTGQLRNTMIVFLSDNGWLQGEHRVDGDKFLPYEESLKVPLIIRGPGVPAGGTVRGQVSNIDFAPTLLDAADADAGRKLDGVSLLPAIRDPKLTPDRVLEIEALAPLFAGPIPVNAWDRPYTGVRTDRYTYVVWTETGEQELYDRKADPHQLENVAADPRFADVKRELARKLRKLRDCAGRECDVKP